MKNHVLPPVFTSALPVPLASIHVSYVQCTVFGLQLAPVSAEVAAPDTTNTLFFSFVTSLTASATPELGTSTIMSTPSASYHLRAIADPTSGLLRWSPETTSTLRLLSFAMKSSTAIFAAITEPGPPMSAYRLDMSLSTPIFTRLPDICASAPPIASALAIAATNSFTFGFIVSTPLEEIRTLDSQVLVEHAGLRLELGGGEGLGDAPMLHHVMAVRERGREPEILLHQHDGEAALLELDDDAPQRLHDHRRESFGDLVEQQQLRAGAKDARHGEHLLLAAGKARTLRGLAALAQVGEHLVDLVDRHAAPGDLRRQGEVLFHRQA